MTFRKGSAEFPKCEKISHYCLQKSNPYYQGFWFVWKSKYYCETCWDIFFAKHGKELTLAGQREGEK